MLAVSHMLESAPAVSLTLVMLGGCYLVPAEDETTGTTETETTETETTETETTGCLDCPDHPLDSECGDGVVDAGEACDDGNDVDTDACTNTCTLAACGDGIVYVGAEECDDGNLEDTDACVDCENATCGDGVVYAGTEECDVAADDDCLTCRTCTDTNVKAVAAGGHTCVLLGCGLVECWGSGADGRLGYGNTNNVGDMLTPVEVGALAFSARSTINDHILHTLALGDSHGCVRVDGPAPSPGVACWGNGGSGRVGYGNTDNLGDDGNDVLGVPVALPLNVDEFVLRISAGAAHTCVLTSERRVLCWGEGENGRLGYGDTDDILDPSQLVAVDLYLAALDIAAGGAHTCALLSDRSVVCWGSGHGGRLGTGDTVDVLEPNLAALDDGYQISAGAEHTCAVLYSDRSVRCWGSGQDGRLGYGDTQNVDAPAAQPAISIPAGESVERVVAGAAHTCVLTEQGNVSCWGSNADGRLGYGDRDSRYAPDGVVLDDVLQIAAGGAHTCALLGRQEPSGDVVCWGYGGDGRLGYGDTMTRISVPLDPVPHR